MTSFLLFLNENKKVTGELQSIKTEENQISSAADYVVFLLGL